MAEHFVVADASSDVGSDDWEIVAQISGQASAATQEFKSTGALPLKDSREVVKICDIWEKESLVSCSDGDQVSYNVVEHWEQQSFISLSTFLLELQDDQDQQKRMAGNLEEMPTEREERRQLCDVLWYSQPQWSPSQLHAAEQRLAKAGISNLHLLLEGLMGNLNQKVRAATREGLACGTVGQLRRHLGVARGGKLLTPRPKMPTLKETSCTRSQGRKLCDALWEARPAWTPTDLLAAERKLQSVGVDSLETLRNALDNDLNSSICKAGFRPFHADSIAALQQHIGASQRPLGEGKMCEDIN